MATVLSDRDSKVADRILSDNSDHLDSVIQAIEQLVLPQLKQKNEFLDIGTGSGIITRAIAKSFQRTTVVEPNEEFRRYLEGPDYNFVPLEIQRASFKHGFDFVLCSHMLYHVDPKEWLGVIDKMISLVNPNGLLMINLIAQRGYNHEFCLKFVRDYPSSTLVTQCLKTLRAKFDVFPAEYQFNTWTYEDMYAVCRYFILEDLFTRKTYEALSQHEKEQIDASIRRYAMERKTPHGNFGLTHHGDYIIVQSRA